MNEEFVEQHNLVIKFLAGEITEEELIILKSWLEESAENRLIFDKENEIWQQTSFQTQLEHYRVDHGWKNISAKLGFGNKMPSSLTIVKKINYALLIAAACLAILVAIGSLYLFIDLKNKPVNVLASMTTVSTREGEKAHVYLPDSTEVTLNSGSSIQYDANFNLKERIVKFSGEAFFNVATNHKKPFVVKLDKMSIIATGTRFNVFSFGNEDRVETTLEEGAISVSIPGSEAIEMKSGEQIVYFVRSKKIQVSEVATDTYTSWKENKLRFNDTPFEEVLRRIGRKYNVRFEIASHDLLNLKYTATFIDESIEEVMQMLQTVSPITYKIYNITTINDKKYTKPKIVVGKRKELKRNLNPKPKPEILKPMDQQLN
jgi:transmembrane sensor